MYVIMFPRGTTNDWECVCLIDSCLGCSEIYRIWKFEANIEFWHVEGLISSILLRGVDRSEATLRLSLGRESGT